MNTVHIMLDLETWGKEPGCDIRSIGACVFDPPTGYVSGARNGSNSFYRACDNPLSGYASPQFDDPRNLNYYEGVHRRYNLRRDPQTVQWWSEQSLDAQAAFADPDDLREALREFTQWLNAVGWHANIRLWSHGPAFDIAILAAVYKATSLPVPWNYRTPRDTRTAFDMAGIADDGDGSYRTFMNAFNTGTHHHALDDAIAQAKAVCAAYKLLRDRQIGYNAAKAPGIASGPSDWKREP